MTHKEVLEDLNHIFKKTLKNESLLLKRETTAQDVDEWDSLTNVDLMVAIEKHFNIKFKFSDFRKIKALGDLCDLIVIKKEAS